MNDYLQIGIAGLLAALLTACASTTSISTTSTAIQQVTNSDELKPLALLITRETSRRDIEARFGAPWSIFEDGRIVIHHLDRLAEPIRRVERDSNLHLVLVHAKDDRVERWSLVQMDRPQ